MPAAGRKLLIKGLPRCYLPLSVCFIRSMALSTQMNGPAKLELLSGFRCADCIEIESVF
jgi:hypothetical protein